MVKSQCEGVIDPSFLYRFDVASKIMGWGKIAGSEAEKRGLKVMRSGKRRYVLGRDLVAFIQADSEARAAQ